MVSTIGVLSSCFVTAKYVALIMRADNRGEGGILALTALVSRGLGNHGRRRWWLVEIEPDLDLVARQ